MYREPFISTNYMNQNCVFILDEITPKNCAQLIGDLTLFVIQNSNTNTPLQVIINSVGGDVYTMMTIIGLLTLAKEKEIPVITFVMGLAASAASIIAIHGDIRYMTKLSRHFVHFGTICDITRKYDEIEKVYAQNKDYANRINDIYLSKCKNLNQKLLQELQNDERGYLTAEECLKLGFCDEIVEDTLDKKLELNNHQVLLDKLYLAFKNKDLEKIKKLMNTKK